MDTQGIFDSKSTMLDNLTISALTAVLSSVQILNLSNNLQENDLQNLQLFTEFGRVAMAAENRKPFQELMFLIRDWSFPYEFNYGFEGGENYLKDNFQQDVGQAEELSMSRTHIKSCYEKISCFLMPSPGMNVITSRNFRGELKDIDTEFLLTLTELVSGILAPQNIRPKRIGDRNIKAGDLLEYFDKYCKEFGAGQMEGANKIVGATSESNILTAKNSASEHYNNKMFQHTGENLPIISENDLEELHINCYNEALYIVS